MVRAIMSVEPPGGNGTSSVTGFEGHAWAERAGSGEAEGEGGDELSHGLSPCRVS